MTFHESDYVRDSDGKFAAHMSGESAVSLANPGSFEFPGVFTTYDEAHDFYMSVRIPDQAKQDYLEAAKDLARTTCEKRMKDWYQTNPNDGSQAWETQRALEWDRINNEVGMSMPTRNQIDGLIRVDRLGEATLGLDNSEHHRYYEDQITIAGGKRGTGPETATIAELFERYRLDEINVEAWREKQRQARIEQERRQQETMAAMQQTLEDMFGHELKNKW